VAHPEIAAAVLSFLLHNPEHAGDVAAASRGATGVEGLAVVAVSHVDPPISRDGMGIDGRSGRDAVLPFLLHFCVHD